jgi:hypothetical protein
VAGYLKSASLSARYTPAKQLPNFFIIKRIAAYRRCSCPHSDFLKPLLKVVYEDTNNDSGSKAKCRKLIFLFSKKIATLQHALPFSKCRQSAKALKRLINLILKEKKCLKPKKKA